jgi:hypothetical protein
VLVAQPVILSKRQEIRKIEVLSLPANSSQDPISKKKNFTKKVGGVAQGVGPKFKPQYQKKKALKKKQFEPAPVAHTYNPVYSGIRDQEDEVQSQLPALSK